MFVVYNITLLVNFVNHQMLMTGKTDEYFLLKNKR